MSLVEDGDQGLRFPDPRQVLEKAFELHLRKDLPGLIKKCQGMCGKVIRPNDNGMLANSYGTSTWTDRKAGQEKSKFGTVTSVHSVWKPLTEKTIMDQVSASITKEFKLTAKYRRNLPKQKRSF